MPKTIERKTGPVLSTIFVLIVGWFVARFTRFQWVSSSELYWIAIFYFLCCIPTIVFVAGHKFRIPLMPMWGLGYFMLFGVPLLGENELNTFSWMTREMVVAALKLVVLGGVVCLATFYGPLGRWVDAVTPKLKLPWDQHRASKIGVVLIVAGLFFYYYSLTSPPTISLGQLLFLFSQLAVVGILTLFLLQMRGLLSRRLIIFLWGIAVPANLLLALGTGALWQVITRLSPIFFCYAAERRRLPWAGILFAALCLIPFLGFKGEYRSYAWYGETPEDIIITPSPLQRGLAFMQLTSLRLREGGVESFTVAAETAESRVNHLELLATVTDMTPALVPYWNGETYRDLIWVLAPRFLFPNKPLKTVGQEFGHRYGLLHEEDFTTSFNLPHQVIEMYANFGLAGIIFGMAIIGLLYRSILALLSRPDSGERGIIICCALLGNLLSLDSSFSLIFGGVIYYILLLALFTRFLQPKVETR